MSVLFACQSSNPPQKGSLRRPSPIAYPSGPGTYPTGDAENVYRAALDVLYGTGIGSPRIVVLSELVAAQAVNCRSRCLPFGKPGSKIAIQTLADLTEQSNAPIRARPDLKYRIPIVLLPIEPEKALSPEETTAKSKKFRFQGSEWWEHPFWTEFVQEYPGAWGFARMSAVGFDPQHTEAAVQVAHRCGTYCGSTELMYFRKDAGGWRLMERAAYDEQATDLVIGTLRYRGPSARPPRWIEAVRDSMKKEAAGRGVSGVITDSTTGKPLVGAAVVFHAFSEKPYSPRHWGSNFTDSSGRYRIDNPPEGSFLLVVECPSSTDRAGFVIKFDGSFVERLSQEVVNLTADARRCRRPTYPRTIEDSSAGTTAGGADVHEDNAAVHRAVLDAIYPLRKNDKSVVVLSEWTRSDCNDAIECRSERLDSLRSKSHIDTSTIASFARENHLRSPLRMASGYRRDIALLPAGEREFLEEQAALYEGPLRFAIDYQDKPLWRMVVKAYPTARGLVSVSNIGYDSGRNEALVEVSDFQKRGGENRLMLLRKKDGVWVLVGRF
jgi:hypothetical protein